jgi:tryptophan synthase alpha chain
MNNRLTQLFQQKKERVLNVYCTAGYPHLNSTGEVILSLQKNGADIIEIGMPYSDPLADGPVIQKSNMQALQNGMTITLLFEQLNEIKLQTTTPIILMGYFNPVLQYGVERFCAEAVSAGISGVILPDLPEYEYEHTYKHIFEKYSLSFIFLISPETDQKRVRKADKLSSGFLYAVSSSSTTGGKINLAEKADYFLALKKMKLTNPFLIGFGISEHEDFETVCKYANGAITGSAYIKAITNAEDINDATASFIKTIIKEN